MEPTYDRHRNHRNAPGPPSRPVRPSRSRDRSRTSPISGLPTWSQPLNPPDNEFDPSPAEQQQFADAVPGREPRTADQRIRIGTSRTNPEGLDYDPAGERCRPVAPRSRPRPASGECSCRRMEPKPCEVCGASRRNRTLWVGGGNEAGVPALPAQRGRRPSPGRGRRETPHRADPSPGRRPARRLNHQDDDMKNWQRGPIWVAQLGDRDWHHPVRPTPRNRPGTLEPAHVPPTPTRSQLSAGSPSSNDRRSWNPRLHLPTARHQLRGSRRRHRLLRTRGTPRQARGRRLVAGRPRDQPDGHQRHQGGHGPHPRPTVRHITRSLATLDPPTTAPPASGLLTSVEGRAVPYGEYSIVGFYEERHAYGSLDRYTSPGSPPLPLLLNHGRDDPWPIGKSTSWRNQTDGLHGQWQLYDTPNAQRAGRDLPCMSITFCADQIELEHASQLGSAGRQFRQGDET